MLNIKKMIDDIANQGWFHQQNVFDEIFTKNAINELSNKNLKSAGIGSKAERHSEIRNDSIFWFEKYHQSHLENFYINFLDNIQKNLNESLYLGIKSHEVHYAQYPQGGFYKPHFDNFKGNNKRIITVITYLNEKWKEEDGGILKLHLQDGIQEIQPKSGSFIAFLSEHILHEVTTSFKERHSITGWLLNNI